MKTLKTIGLIIGAVALLIVSLLIEDPFDTNTFSSPGITRIGDSND